VIGGIIFYSWKIEIYDGRIEEKVIASFIGIVFTRNLES
jgi:hypothetical protein